MLPLYSLLIVYYLFLLIFVIFVAINIYHIVVSASLTVVSFFVTFFVIAAGLLTIYGTWALLQDINFQQPLLGLPTPNNSFGSPVSSF